VQENQVLSVHSIAFFPEKNNKKPMTFSGKVTDEYCWSRTQIHELSRRDLSDVVAKAVCASYAEPLGGKRRLEHRLIRLLRH
jgi:hypothetical protein